MDHQTEQTQNPSPRKPDRQQVPRKQKLYPQRSKEEEDTEINEDYEDFEGQVFFDQNGKVYEDLQQNYGKYHSGL